MSSPMPPPDKGSAPDDPGTVNWYSDADVVEAFAAAIDAQAAMSADLTTKVERIVKAQRAQDSDDEDPTTLTLDASLLLEAIAPDLRYTNVHCPAAPRAHDRNSRPRPRARTRQSHRTRPGHRRSGSTSRTSSNDPGASSDGPEPPRGCPAESGRFGVLGGVA